MTYRLRNIGIAVALAVVAALLTTFYVANYKKSVRKDVESVRVYVAAKDIPAGTLGSEAVAKDLLTTKEVTRDAVVPGTISSPDQIKSQIALQPVYAGEQVTARRFGPVVVQGIRSQLKGTYRAVQVSGDANQLLAGTLKAGDRVDVVGVLRLKRGSDEVTFSRVVIRDVRVLRTSGASGGAKISLGGSPGSNYWAILRVTDSQSQKLALVYESGEYWSLELRPGLNAADSPNSVESIGTLLTDGLSQAQIARLLGVRAE